MPRRRRPLVAAALLAALAPVAAAQEANPKAPPPAAGGPAAPGTPAEAPPLTPEEAYAAKLPEIRGKIALAFEYPALYATQYKLKKTSLAVWQVVLEYDPEHRKARDYLGFEKRGGEWTPSESKQKKIAAVEDEGEEKRGEFEKRLQVARTNGARLLSELGALADAARDEVAAKEHWKKALAWDDQDPLANERLGNQLVDGRWYSRRRLAHKEFEKKYLERLAKAQGLKVEPALTEESSGIPEAAGLKFRRYRTANFRFESDLPDVEVKETLVWLERSRAFFLDLFHVPEARLDFSREPYVLLSAKNKVDHDKLVDACPEIPDARKSFQKKFSGNMLSRGAIATYADGATAQREAIHTVSHFFVAQVWGRPGPWLLEALANAVSAAVRSADLKVCFSGQGSVGSIKLENMKLADAPGVLRELVLAKRDTPMEEFVPLPSDGMTPQNIAKAWSVVMFLLEKDPRLAIDWIESASAGGDGKRSRDAQYLGAYFADLPSWKALDEQWREWAADVYRK